jgi:hypothetical protein
MTVNGKITFKQAITTKINVNNYKLNFTRPISKPQTYRHLEPLKFPSNVDKYLVWKL